MVNDGTTLLLTTQYLEEADQLADDIVVIDKGEIIAHGTPLQLKEQAGAASLELTVSDAADIDAAAALLRKAAGRCSSTATPGDSPPRPAASATSRGRRVARRQQDLRRRPGLARPSLDDVFLALTGHRAEDDEKTPTQPNPAWPPVAPGLRRSHDDQRIHHLDGGGPHREPPADQSDQPVAAGRTHGVAQPDLHQTHAGDAVGRDGAADHVRAPVRVRVRCRDRRPGASYKEFLLPGIMGQTMMFTAFIVASGLTNDLEKGIIDRFRSLPIQRSSVLVGGRWRACCIRLSASS